MTAPLAGLSILDRSTTRAGSACFRLLEALGAERGASHGASGVAIADIPASTVVGRRVSVHIRGCDGPSPAYGPEIAAELTGAHAALAAIAALRHGRRQRRSVRVDVDQAEVVASCLGESVSRVICPRRSTGPPPTDTRPRVVACADGHVGIATPTRADLEALATLTGVIDPEGPALDAHLASARRDELVELGQVWRLPIVPVLSPAEALSRRRILGAPYGSSPFLGENLGVGSRRPARRFGPLPLSDVLVLDLGMVWAGPWCGRLLAGLGAQVVKIEGPSRPDGTRGAAGDCTGVFGDLNRGKRSLVLDLGRQEGRAAFLRLAASADVLIENFSPRVLPNFGLDRDLLAQVNPGLVLLSMPAFPSRGLWSGYVAYGGGLELAAGLASSGSNGVPVPATVPYLDYLSGCYGAAAILAALVARDSSGRGARVELAQWALATFLVDANGGRAASTADGSDLNTLLARLSSAEGGFLSRRPQPGQPCHHYQRLPLTLSGVSSRRERAAPGFGTDSRLVLETWAATRRDAFDELARAGIVREETDA